MTIQLVKKQAIRIANGNARVKPGQAFRLNEAAAVGDGVWQGDLGVEVVDKIPDDYESAKPREQLVPGNTVGSRHTLADPSTVSHFALPRDWSADESYDGLMGPAFVAKKETIILHPTHGDVIIAAGHVIQCRYQRNLDLIEKRERRALD